MRAILAGAVESSRVALGAIARTPGWTLPLVISLPRDLDGRHSDFADLSGPARAAGAEFLATRNINTPETLDAIRAADADYVFVIGWSQICGRSEEHTSELQSLMRISYAVFCLKKKNE